MFRKYTIICSAICLFASLNASSQNVTSTPYSQFGLGTLQKNNSVINLSMAGLSNGIRFENAINAQNPASYSGLKWTTFEVGASGSFIELKSNASSAFRNNASLNYIKVAFPVGNKMGASFGLLPISGMGYESKINARFVDTAVTQIYKGSGGLNQFYVGTAYAINSKLSFGINVSYIFGTLDKTKANEFPDSVSFLNIEQTNSTYIGSLFLNYGIQYKTTLDNNNIITIGINGNPPINLNATRNTVGIRYRYVGSSFSVVDTVQNTEEQKGKLYFPMINSFGFSYSKPNKWLIGADITIGQWSNLKIYDVAQNLSNTTDISIGGSYTPNYIAVGNYLKNIEYRFGLNYNKSYVNILSENINQMSVSFGMGLPMPKSASTINLAVELGKRGTLNKGLIEERFIGVYAGFNFCDKWFIKRKYD